MVHLCTGVGGAASARTEPGVSRPGPIARHPRLAGHTAVRLPSAWPSPGDDERLDRLGRLGRGHRLGDLLLGLAGERNAKALHGALLLSYPAIHSVSGSPSSA